MFERFVPSEPPGPVLHGDAGGSDSFLAATLAGLSRPEKALPCRFLYDARGSRLFDLICEQPEYYPTRTELRILERHAEEIAGLIGPDARLVELGSGSGHKVRLLLAVMDRPAAYIPVDISREPLDLAARSVAAEWPNLTVHAVWADYTTAFVLPSAPGGRRVGFFPGSTIGNFEREEARDFLAVWAQRLGPGGGLIVGVDLRKPEEVLERAYDDAAGVTAAFSLNILARANRELGADFDLEGFRHHARWVPDPGRVEIHLVSRRSQVVTVAGRQFRFSPDERLHVENSHKYDVEEFAALARGSGFEWQAAWTDPERLFSVHFLSVSPTASRPL
ncbi:MAG TPA: L-histidine N(alpha)-methyltransferase [Caulobacteraceae bacterium]|jgi:dimethylhistidine N-methyltransferase|nr:L-histidine N(alpha)-methyltransferase [Caulobacteraceae bacterium]